eukprot:scaffold314064_cov32-Tisochrysis_lutea.AAC.5
MPWLPNEGKSQSERLCLATCTAQGCCCEGVVVVPTTTYPTGGRVRCYLVHPIALHHHCQCPCDKGHRAGPATTPTLLFLYSFTPHGFSHPQSLNERHLH